MGYWAVVKFVVCSNASEEHQNKPLLYGVNTQKNYHLNNHHHKNLKI